MINSDDNQPWPVYGIDLPSQEIRFAGDEATQYRLDRQARRMVETFRMRAEAPLWTRFSLPWLNEQKWQVLLLPGQLSEEQEDQLASTLRQVGNDTLYGALVEPEPSPPAAVFRFPTTAGNIVDFNGRHVGFRTLIFPPDCSMALHFDSDNITLAGPAEFLRAAVPERAALRAQVARDNRSLSEMYNLDWLGPLIRHYEAVTLLD